MIYGIGVNDLVGYSGEKSYHTWRDMLKKVNKGASICPSWLTFSNFLSWFNDNYVVGYTLSQGEVFSPECSRFYPRHLTQVIEQKHGKGYGMRKGSYRVVFRILGKPTYVGVTKCELVAEELASLVKSEYIQKWREYYEQ